MDDQRMHFTLSGTHLPSVAKMHDKQVAWRKVNNNKGNLAIASISGLCPHAVSGTMERSEPDLSNEQAGAAEAEYGELLRSPECAPSSLSSVVVGPPPHPGALDGRRFPWVSGVCVTCSVLLDHIQVFKQCKVRKALHSLVKWKPPHFQLLYEVSAYC